ncbi:hypothetical protein [Thiocystis violacea]|uniref:hypothetical protein n=1 Tax=Thiocystis violacea TaxID=13725 RepID=UPI00190374EB|nr:hypothetical protein [Thiocystis violacea]
MNNRHLITGLFLAVCHVPASSSDCNQILIDTGNTAACGTTQTAMFNLQSAVRVSTINVWYDTRIGGRSLPFTLQGPGGQIYGEFQATSCDPYQSQWCEGQFIVNSTLQHGQYTVNTSIPAVCQNSGSGGNGFVKLKGCFPNSGPQNNTNAQGTNCIPGTNPFQEDACVKPKW